MVSYDVLYAKLTQKGVSEVTLARTLTARQAQQVRELNLDGVYLASVGMRSYTYGDFLSQVLGFVSSDGLLGHPFRALLCRNEQRQEQRRRLARLRRAEQRVAGEGEVTVHTDSCGGQNIRRRNLRS